VCLARGIAHTRYPQPPISGDPRTPRRAGNHLGPTPDQRPETPAAERIRRRCRPPRRDKPAGPTGSDNSAAPGRAKHGRRGARFTPRYSHGDCQHVPHDDAVAAWVQPHGARPWSADAPESAGGHPLSRHRATRHTPGIGRDQQVRVTYRVAPRHPISRRDGPLTASGLRIVSKRPARAHGRRAAGNYVQVGVATGNLYAMNDGVAVLLDAGGRRETPIA
jgi:hypothetical protein